MNSIFQNIKSSHSTPQVIPPKDITNKKNIITQWKQNKSEQNTRRVIQLLKPTIDSALHTYAPGQQKQLQIKAINIALDSLKNFDQSKKIAPSTYIFTSLQRLNRVRRQRQNIIHIPESQVYMKSLIDKQKDQLQNKLGRQATQDELSDALGLSKKKIQRLYTGAIFNQGSTINPQSGDSTFKIKGLTQDDYFKYVYDSVSSTDKKIMQWTKNKNINMSNNQIAKKLKISPGAVSQRKAKIQEMLGRVRGLL